MSFRYKIIIVFASVAVSLYALIGGSWAKNFVQSISAQQTVNDAGSQMRIFESVLQHIQNDYVDEPNMEKVRGGALRGLAYGLDPYSSYLTADQVKDFQAQKTSTKVGIGAELSQVASYLYVIAAVKGSPAETAGLKSGDVIEYIENKATRDISLYDGRQLLTGDAGTKVKLRVLRSGSKPQTIEVTRGTFKTPNVESRLESGKIGVIKVFSLDEGEAGDIRNKVQELSKQGVVKIILDLRGVAGGKLNEAVAVSNLFIKDGALAQVLGRENKIVNTFTADSSKAVFDGKLVTLIDLGTSGAAEVVAAAMLDRQRGDVVGERSFGAGTEQQLFTLRGGDGLLLTTSKWASANGNAFLGEDAKKSGVKPSVEVKRAESPEPIDPEDLVNQNENQPNEAPKVETPKPPTEDLQFKKAIELLADKVMTKTAGE
jgi:carboxyl-terminal processing protease